MKKNILIAACLYFVFNPQISKADEANFILKDAPGVDMLYSKCVGCHSLDYVEMNSPFLDKKGWEKTVSKMIKVMGAQANSEEEQIIINYLTKNYGK